MPRLLGHLVLKGMFLMGHLTKVYHQSFPTDLKEEKKRLLSKRMKILMSQILVIEKDIYSSARQISLQEGNIAAQNSKLTKGIDFILTKSGNLLVVLSVECLH